MKAIKKVTVIGAGIMGAGIAKSIFKQGFNVTLFDLDTDVLNDVYNGITKRVRKNLNPDNIKKAGSIEDAVKNADLVIEAIVENINIKCSLFNQIGKIAPPDTIFASNTSSLSISQMAEASGRKERFLGLHFFNPAIIMRLVEITVTESLSDNIFKVTSEFIAAIKKTGIKCIESPGFVVNRILLPVINEAFYLLEERVRTKRITVIEAANEIDSAVLNNNLLLMGPFDLADLTGLDTIYNVAETIYQGFNNSPRYIPSQLLKSYLDEGTHGRKKRQGVYFYGNTTNDPDYNPCLDENRMVIKRINKFDFDILQISSIMVNEGFRVLEEKIVDSYKDVELCMELGTRWERGPFKLAKDFGPDLIYKTLLKKYEASGENPRFEPSSLFKNPTSELIEFYAAD